MADQLMPDRPPTPFAAVLRDRRETLGLSQLEAAHLVGVDERTWRRWEAGDTPAGRHRDAIRECFNIVVGPGASEIFREAEQALAALSERLGSATTADVILRRADGAAVRVEIHAFHGSSASAEDLEYEALALISRAAHDSGWTVHLAP